MNAGRKNQPYTTKLQGVAALLGNVPTSTTPAAAAAHTVPLESIQLPQQQPRRYFDPEKLQQLSHSIKTHGVLEPLLVRSHESEQYELIAGERRYKAAQMAGLTHVPVVVKDLTDEEALQISLIENLQREDLNPIEETEGILQILALQLQATTEEVVSLLYRMQNEAKGKVTQNVLGNSDSQMIQGVFDSLGLMTWESFASSRLPLLRLPDDILIALRQGRLAYTKAQIIARVKDKSKRENLLQEVIEQDLSLTQIKEKAASLKAVDAQPNSQASLSLKSRMGETYKLFMRSDIWDNPKKQKRLEKLLTELESLMAED